MDLRLTDSLELDLAEGLSLVSGLDETAQDAHQLLRTQRGEWELDPSEGVDWLNTVLTGEKGGTTRAADAEIKRAVLQAKGAREVTAYSSAQEGDQLVVRVDLKADDGAVLVDVDADGLDGIDALVEIIEGGG